MFSVLADTRRHIATSLLVGAMLTHPSSWMSAQGLTGASVQGTVVRQEGVAIAHPLVTLLDTSTGLIRRTTGNVKGSFLFDNVPVGGPYRIEARSIGFEPTSIDG